MESKKELRVFTAPVEYREADEGNGTIEGIAAVVNMETNLGWFNEIIMPGAFDEVLKGDTRALFNHDSNQVLARTTSGTLALSINTDGHLVYNYVTPNRTFAKDLEDMIRSGDVSQSSFAFTVKEDSWEYDENGEREIRKIIKVGELYDVSPVTFPAYADTSVAKRCFDDVCQKRSDISTEDNNNNSAKNKEYITRRMTARNLER